MDWYALFVTTGKEEYIQKCVEDLFDGMVLKALVPRRRLTERKGGIVYEVQRLMFPGYVLIYTKMNPEIYYSLKKIIHLHRVLTIGEYYTKISESEITPILKLLEGGDTIEYSKIKFIDSKVIVNSGPLKGMEGTIYWIDKRKNRAKIHLEFMSESRTMDVGIEMIDLLN